MPPFLFLLSRHREVYPLHIMEVLLVVVLGDVLLTVCAVNMFFFVVLHVPIPSLCPMFHARFLYLYTMSNVSELSLDIQ